ncbi:glycogen synthase GlgA [Acidihalobacter ferrooxydans]|uniref:Glycogen synthase n=1 Tax=Acidihalobacter ferrooxydans TaxID=1765967 RepID=A0A1P8UE00_9GAMM|nr:glycogen synthase GlgA [Acidihalobacter ferrooxydans]APZ42092.1 starch synthase [Acidihalobacter ferrooxydans]
MRILFASSEAHPLIKTGGLADVSGSLAAALVEQGHDVRLILPAYAAVTRNHRWRELGTLTLPGVRGRLALLEGTLPGTDVTVWLVDAPLYFDRAGDPYRAPDGRDWQDNHLRFGLFSRVIAALAQGIGPTDWQPDILHCNDWQTGLAPALLADIPDRPASVFTIHNLAYQGLFPKSAFIELELPGALWATDGLEFYGQISFIKGGLVFADRLTTVSPTYAREIRTPQYGCGLEGLLNQRAEVISGILNGIDTHTWNPRTDRYISQPYEPTDRVAKGHNRAALRAEFGLDDSHPGPLFGHIGRMVEQKGIDLILAALEPLLASGRAQAVILGSGEQRFEQALQRLAARYPRQLGVQIGYDERIAHYIEAGADAFLMPSRFEPCGLNQLYSLCYGTLPIVHRTGGLADTVSDATPETLAAGTANGFVFDTSSTAGLAAALERAIEAWKQPELWATLMATGAARDSSWQRSAAEYETLYRELHSPG